MGLSSGTFTRPNDFTTDASLGIDPTATKFDQEFDDIKDALDIAIYADGQQTITADIPWNGKKITGLGTATAGTDALNRDTADARYLLKAQLAAGLPVNASITASVGASALTIALKGADGNDPSSTNTVLLPFRSATAGTGSLTVRSVTAATSLVISSGSTLGTTSSISFRIWVVAFDDGGTIRLAAINCYRSGNADIKRIYSNQLASSTAEGGAGAADSAHVFYTGTAVTTKPYVVLGYLEWDGGLATAGTWSGDATLKVNYAPGSPLPGDLLYQNWNTAAGAGTTTMPLDGTTVQNTEGNQGVTLSITPTSKANYLSIRAYGPISSSSTEAHIGLALFQDSTANALSTTISSRNAAANQCANFYHRHTMLAGTTSSTTFKYRAGTNGAGTTTFGSNLLGSSLAPFMMYVEEWMT